jgi:hypothetical protein
MRPMTSKERVLIEAFLDFNKRDLPKQVKDYKEFLDILILLQDAPISFRFYLVNNLLIIQIE